MNYERELLKVGEVADIVVLSSDVRACIGVRSDDTIRQWIKKGAFPPPDVKIDERTMAWKQSTLAARLGVAIPHIEPTKQPYKYAERAFHLYRHFDAAGTLLYVGVSLNALNRLLAHRRRAPWFWNIARIEVARYPTRQESLDAERQAVQQERPLFNIQHATRKQA